MRVSRSLLAVLLCLALMLSACAKPATEPAVSSADPTTSETPVSSAASEEAAAPVSFTDMAGQAVSLEAPATKIVALTASDCEILYAIGAGDTLVGRGEYCNYPEECLSLPQVSSGVDTNLESILALAPQAVVMSTMAQSEEQMTALRNAGVAVVVSDAQTIDGVYEAISMLGALTGRTGEAEALCSSMQQAFIDLKAKVADGEKKTVYFEVSPLEWGLWAAGSGTFMNEIADMLHLENIFSDVTGWGEVSEEQVIDRNPDYIVTTTMYFGEGPSPVEELMGRTGWTGVAAVAENHVFNADNDAITRPGPRLVDAANAIYEFVYGG